MFCRSCHHLEHIGGDQKRCPVGRRFRVGVGFLRSDNFARGFVEFEGVDAAGSGDVGSVIGLRDDRPDRVHEADQAVLTVAGVGDVDRGPELDQ
uniref:Uncharacterized protein n=1 Tax=uncultured marine virus TaxID=186617 RepID=A0A0F7L748_9VIRU|nr:hypothetical protein [uncultured marine virus]